MLGYGARIIWLGPKRHLFCAPDPTYTIHVLPTVRLLNCVETLRRGWPASLGLERASLIFALYFYRVRDCLTFKVECNWEVGFFWQPVLDDELVLSRGAFLRRLSIDKVRKARMALSGIYFSRCVIQRKIIGLVNVPNHETSCVRFAGQNYRYVFRKVFLGFF